MVRVFDYQKRTVSAHGWKPFHEGLRLGERNQAAPVPVNEEKQGMAGACVGYWARQRRIEAGKLMLSPPQMARPLGYRFRDKAPSCEPPNPEKAFGQPL
ncbi:MAG: hypothetical protein ACUVRE_10230 [Thermoanaerobaculaceae bacterium]